MSVRGTVSHVAVASDSVSPHADIMRREEEEEDVDEEDDTILCRRISRITGAIVRL